jgi:hypothetical protein
MTSQIATGYMLHLVSVIAGLMLLCHAHYYRVAAMPMGSLVLLTWLVLLAVLPVMNHRVAHAAISTLTSPAANVSNKQLAHIAPVVACRLP